jgi:hypothetical protein
VRSYTKFRQFLTGIVFLPISQCCQFDFEAHVSAQFKAGWDPDPEKLKKGTRNGKIQKLPKCAILDDRIVPLVSKDLSWRTL